MYTYRAVLITSNKINKYISTQKKSKQNNLLDKHFRYTFLTHYKFYLLEYIYMIKRKTNSKRNFVILQSCLNILSDIQYQNKRYVDYISISV